MLRAGGLIAFPTETVYGLGADAARPDAVARIYQAKGRPSEHPVIVHLPDAEAMPQWATDIPPVAWQLAARFWPGPLTLILKRSQRVPDCVTGGQDTVGLRVPNHPVALALLKAFGGGLAAPSANLFGRVSPTTARHVSEEMADRIDGVIDGGPCTVGLESTILDLSGEEPRILRTGMITADMLAEVLGFAPPVRTSSRVRVPGALPVHYAPLTPLYLAAQGELDAQISLLVTTGKKIAVLSFREPGIPLPDCLWHTLPDNPADCGRELYARLRALDSEHCTAILVEQPPAGQSWDAIRDRLTRAASRK